MKLKPAEVGMLLEAIDWPEELRKGTAELIGDACELLTMKFVVRLHARRKELRKRYDELPKSAEHVDTHRSLASHINLIGQLLVELAEAE